MEIEPAENHFPEKVENLTPKLPISDPSVGAANATNSSQPQEGGAMDYEGTQNARHSLHFVIMFTISQIVGVLCISLVWVWTDHYMKGFAWHSNLDLEFNYHPLFMVIGLVFLYGDAILVYRVLRNTTKMRLKLLHGALHTLAFCFAVVALKAVFDTHNLAPSPKANVYSLHSWIGLTTVILFSMQFFFGFVTFLIPGLSRTIRASYLPLHVFFGVLIFAMAIASCLTGMMEKIGWSIPDYAKRVPPSTLVNFLGLSLISFGGLVAYLISRPQFQRQPLPEEEALNLEPNSPLN